MGPQSIIGIDSGLEGFIVFYKIFVMPYICISF